MAVNAVTNDELNKQVAALRGWKPFEDKVWLAPDEHGNDVMNGWAIVAPTAEDYFEFEGEMYVVPPYRFGGGARGVWDCENPAAWGALLVAMAEEQLEPRLQFQQVWWAGVWKKTGYIVPRKIRFSVGDPSPGRALFLAYSAAKKSEYASWSIHTGT